MIHDRYYQQEAVDSLFHYFTVKSGNPIIAMPTATGKSVVIARFLQRAMTTMSNASPPLKFLVLTHVKELIVQNAKRLQALWPDAPIGINSASVGQRDFFSPIIFAGIASVKNDADRFGFVDMLIIDECHLLSPNGETMYQKFIMQLKIANPRLKIVGLTATAFRMKQGSLTDEGIFTDICYDLTRPEDYVRLITEGFLSPIYPFNTQAKIDVSGVATVGGDFNIAQLDAAADKPTLVQAILRELCEAGRNRRRWLIFNTGVDNAEHAAAMLNGWGIPSAAVHSRLDKDARDRILKDYHDGKLRCVTNNNVLTTGYDEPGIDLIGMCRPTKSPGLWVQMAGRGGRTCEAEGKVNCLLLDFAGNTARLGPINDPTIPGRPKPNGKHDAPCKICGTCGAYAHTSVKFCEYCGAPFPVHTDLQANASNQELIKGLSGQAAPIQQMFEVDSMSCHKHVKKSTGETMIMATYQCGDRVFSEYVKIEQGGGRAQQWWQQRSHERMPETVDEALRMQSELRCPVSIRVWLNKLNGHPEITDYEW